MKEKLKCLLLKVFNNSFLIGCIIMLLVLLGLLIAGCAGDPVKTGIPVTDPKVIEEFRKVEDVKGNIEISNLTAAIYRVKVIDSKSNILHTVDMHPSTVVVFKLDLGQYKVCIQSSGLWGKVTCFDKVVMPGDHEDNQWKIQRKQPVMPKP